MTSIHFVEPGVKVHGRYYKDVLLIQELLPDTRQLSDIYVFQQDSAAAQRPRDTVDLLTNETPDFIPSTLWPPNSPDLNPVDYKVWSVLQEKVDKKWIKDVDELRLRILTAWDELDQTSVLSVITFRVRESKTTRNVLCVCVSVCPRPHAHSIARTRM